MKQTAFVMLVAFFFSNPTFEVLIKNPANFVAETGTFKEGVAICTRRDARPEQAGTIHVQVGFLNEKGELDPSKFIGMRVREELARTADLKSGTIFNATGLIQGDRGKFWMDSDAIEVLDRIKIRDVTSKEIPQDCDELKTAGAVAGASLWLAGIAAGGIVALGAIGSRPSSQVSQHISPS
jgi:hypothetical protein